jgi:hypothetical protein
MIINWKTKYFVLCNKASPGKRQCVREDEINIKPDTPAISSVRSVKSVLRGHPWDKEKVAL